MVESNQTIIVVFVGSLLSTQQQLLELGYNMLELRDMCTSGLLLQ